MEAAGHESDEWGRTGRRLPARSRRWWVNIPLRRKVMAVTAAALVASLPAVVVAVTLQVRLEDTEDEIATTRQATRALDDLNGLVTEATDNVLLYAALRFGGLDGFEEHRQDFRRVREQIPAAISEVEQDMPADLEEEADQATAAARSQIADAEAIVEAGESGNGAPAGTDEGLVELFANAFETRDEANSRLGDLEDTLDRRLPDLQADANALEGHVARTVLASWIIAFAAVVGGAALLTTQIVRRVERLVENSRRFLRGEPLRPFGQARDEIGQLEGGMLAVGTLLEQRREKAEAATRTRDELLARISHELRTPLAGVIDRSATLQEDPDVSPDGRDAARHVVRGGDHVLRLIDDLRDISRLEAGEVSISTVPVGVREVADDAMSLIRPRGADRSITLTDQVPEGLTVAADQQRLRQVLLNLLSNAVKYNRPEGHVQLTAEPRDTTVRISVTDTGPGISPENLARLFRPFERLDAAASGIEGSGIGLALTKTLVEAMGGAITVDSEVGQGTSFHVELPSTAAGAGAMAGPETAAGPEPDRPDVEPPGPETSRDLSPPDPVPGDAGSAGVTRVPGRARPGWRRLHRVVPRSLQARWRDAPVRRKLLAVTLAALVVSVPAIAAAVVFEFRLASARDSNRADQQLLEELTEFQTTVAAASDATSTYSFSVFAGDPLEQSRAEVRQNSEEARRLFAGIQEDLPAGIAATSEEAAAALERQISNHLTLIDPETTADEETDAYLGGYLASGEVREIAGQMENELEDRITAQSQEVSDLESDLTRATLTSWVITFLAVGAGAAAVTTGVVHRVERITENGRRFLQGRPLLPFQSSNDEVGQLAEGLLSIGALLDGRRQEAEAATRARDEFLSRISHEIRTPLTAVIGYGEILEDEDMPEERRAMARDITKGGQQLLTLVDDLLDLAKAETGNLRMAVEPVRLDEITEEATALLRPRAADRSVTVDATLASDLAVNADRQRLRQVILTLLTRAIAASPTGGEVELSSRRHDGAVALAVADRGTGIPSEDLPHLFEPFVQLESFAIAEGGSGVELALSRALVDAMGGSIDVESEVTQGTRITVILPAADTTAAGGEEERARRLAQPPPARRAPIGAALEEQPLVLYTGTGAADIARVEALFRERPEQLQVVPGDAPVLDMARLLRPHLLIVAVDQPDAGIRTLLSELRDDPETAGVQTVVLATHPTPDTFHRMTELGATAVLARPIDPIRLADILDATLHLT